MCEFLDPQSLLHFSRARQTWNLDLLGRKHTRLWRMQALCILNASVDDETRV